MNLFLSVAAFINILLVPPSIVSGQQQSQLGVGEIRQLLVQMKANHLSTKELAILFHQGDDKIGDVIKMLRDPDRDVRLGAQIVIRYLGNDDGMSAWTKGGGFDKEEMTGPIPIPLRPEDYDLIRFLYMRDNMKTEPLMEAYLFALALDGSSRATQLLSDVVGNANKHGFKINESRFINMRTKVVRDGADLAKAVLEEADFLQPKERDFASAKIIACTKSNDKALVEIHVNRGELAQEWYHVVVKKSGDKWKFFSITQVAVS